MKLEKKTESFMTTALVEGRLLTAIQSRGCQGWDTLRDNSPFFGGWPSTNMALLVPQASVAGGYESPERLPLAASACC